MIPKLLVVKRLNCLCLLTFVCSGQVDSRKFTETGRRQQTLVLSLEAATGKTRRWRQIRGSSWLESRRSPLDSQRIGYPGGQSCSPSNSFQTFETEEILRRNGTARIVAHLGRQYHTMARKDGVELVTDNLHLFNDYSTPKPLQSVDKFGKAGVLTNYQWILASPK